MLYCRYWDCTAGTGTPFHILVVLYCKYCTVLQALYCRYSVLHNCSSDMRYRAVLTLDFRGRGRGANLPYYDRNRSMDDDLEGRVREREVWHLHYTTT